MKELRIALLADELTQECLSLECQTMTLTPFNCRWVLKYWKPDLVFVESAWHGRWGLWKYKVATRPRGQPSSNATLANLVSLADDLDIPAIFWNKEDGVHFERFLPSAQLFRHIFTVDENCLGMYRERVVEAKTVTVLHFPVQEQLHYFNGFRFKSFGANFVGSYSRHIHSSRRRWQDMMFSAANAVEMPVIVYDRNSRRRSDNYRFPGDLGLVVKKAVPHSQTARIYKDNLISFNVNTVDDSPSMYSRRLVEIISCGGLAVTNPSPAVDKLFETFCFVVEDDVETTDLLARLKHGPAQEDLDRAAAGAEYVRAHHTWGQRLRDVCNVVGVRI